MANRIGENICKLRKHRNLTQQQLSEIIGVSIAAISKWETGVAHPDIELLPKIATIFDVSIDYIFDYHLSLYDNTMKVIDNAKQVFDSGQQSRAIAMLSEALLRYPNDILIKFNRAQMMIYSSVKPPIDFEKSNVLVEANRELMEVINYTESREIIDESYYLISMSCINLKQFDKALEAITQIHQSSHINTGLALFRISLEQGDINSAIKQYELNLYLSIANIHANTIWTDILFHDDFEKAILFYEMAIDTFKAYSGNNVCRFAVYISTFYERVASFYAKAKKFDETINSLRLAVEYAHLFDDLQTDHDLPQFDRLDANDTAWGTISNQKLRLLNTIEDNLQEDYKELILNNDFVNIITGLKNSLS